MKKVLSWIVLIVCYELFSIVSGLLFKLALVLLNLVLSLPVIIRILAYIFGGSIFCGIVFAPLLYGPPIVISASESVCPSKNGTRYIVFASVMLTLSALMLGISLIAKTTISVGSIYAAIFCVLLIVGGRNWKS